LRFVLCNARSLGNKLQELHYLLYNDNLDVLLIITESWLDDTFTSGLLDPECKVNIYRKDRNRHGGGVCVFVSKVLRSSEVHIDERFNQLEILCFDVFTTSATHRVFVIIDHLELMYSVNYTDGVIQCLSFYCLLSRLNIVTGDLNCPKINWLTSHVLMIVSTDLCWIALQSMVLPRL